MNANELRIGDYVVLAIEKPKGKHGPHGRLEWDKVYKVIGITKDGYIQLNTRWGVSHFAHRKLKPSTDPPAANEDANK